MRRRRAGKARPWRPCRLMRLQASGGTNVVMMHCRRGFHQRSPATNKGNPRVACCPHTFTPLLTLATMLPCAATCAALVRAQRCIGLAEQRAICLALLAKRGGPIEGSPQQQQLPLLRRRLLLLLHYLLMFNGRGCRCFVCWCVCGVLFERFCCFVNVFGALLVMWRLQGAHNNRATNKHREESTHTHTPLVGFVCLLTVCVCVFEGVWCCAAVASVKRPAKR